MVLVQFHQKVVIDQGIGADYMWNYTLIHSQFLYNSLCCSCASTSVLMLGICLNDCTTTEASRTHSRYVLLHPFCLRATRCNVKHRSDSFTVFCSGRDAMRVRLREFVCQGAVWRNHHEDETLANTSTVRAFALFFLRGT